MKNITIKDIAKMAGVSTTVVSFVLNDKPGVNVNTRKTVAEIIERTGFKPNVSSRRLIYQKSFNICIIMRKDSSPFRNLFYFEIAQGLLEKSKEYRYNIVFTDISLENGKLIVPDIIEQNDTDGVIFFQDTEPVILSEIDRRNIPSVLVDAHPGINHHCNVNADYELAARIATTHLVENGHTDIAFICSSFVPSFYTQVFSGFKTAIEEKNISIPSNWIHITADDEDAACKCMNDIIRSGRLPSAVFCAADILAVGAIKCAKASGLRIPEDISFVSVDDILLARYIEPALTTVRIDKAQMGALAMGLLAEIIEGHPARSVTVESDNLIIRKSVCQRN